MKGEKKMEWERGEGSKKWERRRRWRDRMDETTYLSLQLSVL